MGCPPKRGILTDWGCSTAVNAVGYPSHDFISNVGRISVLVEGKHDVERGPDFACDNTLRA